MAKQTIKLPVLGEGVDAGDILEILVSVGDNLEAGQTILEIETDKATVDVPSPVAGTVTEILISEGDTVAIDAPLLSLEVATDAAAPAEAPSPPEEQPAPVAEKPASAPPPVPASAPTPPRPPVEETSPVTAAPPTPVPAPAPPVVPPQPLATSSGIAPAGPAVRRFAREVGVDISAVLGTGPEGRITREDVLAVVRQSSQAGGSATTSVPPIPSDAPAVAQTKSPPTPAENKASPKTETVGDQAQDNWGPVKIEKLPKIRKTIASKMHESWSTCPRVTNFDDADVTELEAMRQASKADYAETGVKLTTMPFVIKAVALALKSNPLLNASIDMVNEQIIFKQYVNVGIAVDTDRGLVVPSLRQADQLSIPAVARGLGEIAKSARTGNFAVADLRGSTFTISNLGAIGGTYSTPIINTPEVAILLVGRSRKMPVVVNEEVTIRLMMPLSLSYDHRLVDGGAAARFLNDVISFLRTPSRLLIAP